MAVDRPPTTSRDSFKTFSLSYTHPAPPVNKYSSNSFSRVEQSPSTQCR